MTVFTGRLWLRARHNPDAGQGAASVAPWPLSRRLQVRAAETRNKLRARAVHWRPPQEVRVRSPVRPGAAAGAAGAGTNLGYQKCCCQWFWQLQ